MKLYTRAAVIVATTLALSTANTGLTLAQNLPPIPVSVTLSGGVSLGAYQAGFLYYLSEIIKKNPDVFKPKLATGSSAGGINTLLYVLSVCAENELSPQQNPFWSAWMHLSAKDFVGPISDKRALASRQGFDKIAEAIHTRFNLGLPAACDMVLGITAARLRPDRSAKLSSVDLAREVEHFVLRIQGQGIGHTPLISNYANAATPSGATLLDLQKGDANQNFESLRDLLFATSAFPLVFAPQKLNYCITDPSQDRWVHAEYPLVCAPTDVQSAEFIDGGLFDNKPLGLADRTARSGLNSSSSWNAIPMLDQQTPKNNSSVLYLYSDISSTAYPTSTDKDPATFLSTANLILQDVLNSSRDGDSVSLFEQNPALISQIAHAQNLYPRAGDPMLGFFGFFERDFREFDFYLGMYEAQLFVKNKLSTSLYRGQNKVAATAFTLPESNPALATQAQWQPFNCLKSLLDGSENKCDSSVSENFRILALTSVERLSALCSEYGRPGTPDSSCARVPTNIHEKYQNGEDDFGFTLRKLAANEFEFRDLGLPRSHAADAGPKIKTESIKTLDRLADTQPGGDKFALKLVGPSLMNLIEPIPTESEYFALVGPSFKFGGSFLLSGGTIYPSTLRLVASAQINNIETWFGSQSGHPAPAAMLGLESELPNFRSQLARALFGVHAGYQFNSSSDNIPKGSRDPNLYNGVVIEPSLSFTLFDRLRLQIDFEILPFAKDSDDTRTAPWAFLPSIGVVF